ncbi:MAG: hypothetical protein GX567_19665, partial [Clostridia bacterium]|nr:hypothetical protein [Clostridia bacterium]
PWWLRYQNILYPGDALPIGGLAGADLAPAQCLLAVKPFYDAHPGAGIACAAENRLAGESQGLVRITVENGRALVYAPIGCQSPDLALALRQMVCQVAGLPPVEVSAPPRDTALANGLEVQSAGGTIPALAAARRAAQALAEALKEKGSLAALQGREFLGSYTCRAERGGSSFTGGFAAHCMALDDQGRVAKVAAAHDFGRLINPLYGEVRVLESVAQGLALAAGLAGATGQPAPFPETEIYPVSNQLPEALLQALPAAGVRGVGQIAALPGLGALQGAYLKRDGRLCLSLPFTGRPAP